MIVEWIRLHETLLGYLGVISLVTFVLTIILIPLLVIRIPPDYFLYDKEHLKQFHRQHPFVRVLTLVMKNILGVVFIGAGIAMLVLPGQGLLTILIGLMLVSFPKKRALECHIIQKDGVLRAINWMRTKAHRSLLRLPEGAGDHARSKETSCAAQRNDD